MRRVRNNLPLLLALAITVAFSSDLPLLALLKSEQTFGWWLVVGVPAAMLLFGAQIALWTFFPTTRPWSRQRARGHGGD